MQISKSTYLQRLLRTQDILLSTLTFNVAVDLLWLLGVGTANDAVNQLKLLPFVAVFSWFASRSETPGIHGQRLLKTALYAARFAAITTIGILAIAYLFKLGYVSRYALVAYGTLLTLGLTTNRLFLRWWYFTGRREHPENYLQVLVIGTGQRAHKLLQAYEDNSQWGINTIGMLDPKQDFETMSGGVDGPPVLGDVSKIREILVEHVVDEVIVCLPRSLLDEIGMVVDACAEEGICIRFLADLYEIDGGQYQLETIGSWPVLALNPVTTDHGALFIKRIVDLIITIPAILLLSPVYILVALAIKLDSKGPVFFRQPRVRLNKRHFRMIKFRSMYQDAEARLKEVEHLNEAEGPIFKMKNDPRTTRVGRFIRRTSIDELPQLFNVLFGQMSLVGPRPMSLRDVSRFSQGVQRKRFSVRPGLACLREVSGRSALSFDQWLALDLKYIAEWSLWLDAKILFRLLPAVIKGDGAS